MTPSSVTVACCQLAPSIGHVSDNLDAAGTMIRQARESGAEIVVLPELATSGYAFSGPEEAAQHAEPVDGPTVALYLTESLRATVIGGFCEAGPDGATYNSAVVASGGEVLAVYRKVHLWGDEQRNFAPGGEVPPVVATPHGRIGLGICYDLEFPEVARSMAVAGADLVVFPTNWPASVAPTGERPMLHTLAMATARHSRVYVAVCDRAGSERGLGYLGGSIIVGPDGWPVAEATPEDGPQILLSSCDLGTARDKRLGADNDVIADRRPRLYTRLAEAPQAPQRT
jgi:predicted amidohydrolase